MVTRRDHLIVGTLREGESEYLTRGTVAASFLVPAGTGGARTSQRAWLHTAGLWLLVVSASSSLVLYAKCHCGNIRFFTEPHGAGLLIVVRMALSASIPPKLTQDHFLLIPTRCMHLSPACDIQLFRCSRVVKGLGTIRSPVAMNLPTFPHIPASVTVADLFITRLQTGARRYGCMECVRTGWNTGAEKYLVVSGFVMKSCYILPI